MLDKARRSVWLGWLLDNPLLVREMRRRMRGRLFTWSLIAYVAALSGVSCILMFISYPSDEVDLRNMIQRVGSIGSTLFIGMAIVEGVVAIIIAPMLTSGLATAEKEKDTFDFLRVTTLRARTFVGGCLLTTACFLLLVFSCTLPILGLTFIFGGVSMEQILSLNIVLFLVAMAVSSWGIFNSTNYRRSRSVRGSIVLVLMAGFIGLLFYANFRSRAGGMASLLAVQGGFLRLSFLVRMAIPLILITILFAVAASRRLYDANNRLFNYKQFTTLFLLIMAGLGGGLVYRVSSLNPNPAGAGEIEVWLNAFHFAGWIGIAIAILFFSTGRIEKGDEVWRIRLKYPLFRRLNESFLLYFAYLLLWLAPVYLMALAWDETDAFSPHFVSSLPAMFLALLVVWSLARVSSVFTENRNRATVGVIFGLVMLWAILPLIGVFITEVLDRPVGSLAPALDDAATVLTYLSPIPTLLRIYSDSTDRDVFLPLALLAAQSALFLLPLASRKLRKRLEVSYEWTRPEPSPAPEPLAEPAAG
ncbi:hypothetical protein IIC65_07935 [Candidatus Sumerlaeota bacterium]|nr:hypothetical protein [Candidatus Sumerlaeota bacterium]